MVIWRTPWKKYVVCDKCKDATLMGVIVRLHCVKCGHIGSQKVSRRYVVSLFGIKKEYKQHMNIAKKFKDK